MGVACFPAAHTDEVVAKLKVLYPYLIKYKIFQSVIPYFSILSGQLMSDPNRDPYGVRTGRNQRSKEAQIVF